MNRLRADLVLLLVALIWGCAFTVQRVAARHFDPFTFNGLRFLLGAVVLYPFTKVNPLSRTGRDGQKTIPSTEGHGLVATNEQKSIMFILLAGSALFGGSWLQQEGLESTTAGNAGFITTLYVVIVPVLLLVFWKEKIHWISWLGAGIAVIGSLLLSTGGALHLAPGDGLVMASAVLWALHVIVVGRAVKHMDVLRFSAGQYFVAGVLNLLVSLGLNMSYGGLSDGWWTVVYIGVISTALGYTLQGWGQKYAPPTDTTILLSMEAVFAALTGFIFLGETMLPIQLFGCVLILAAVLLTQLKTIPLKASLP